MKRLPLEERLKENDAARKREREAAQQRLREKLQERQANA